jgi:putative lipoprotein
MRSSRFILFSLLPLFAACQVWTPNKTDLNASTRLQGELSRLDGKLVFRTCTEQRRFSIEDTGNTGLPRDALEMFNDGATSLYADLRGSFSGSSAQGTDGKLEVAKVYRLQNEGSGCDDPNFKRAVVRAHGNEPGWSVLVNGQGMLIEQPGKQSLVLPYIAEGVPDGSTSYSSEANGEKVELWVAPARCQDSMSGALSNLSAELRLDDKVMRGCAYPGGSSGD